MSPILENGLTPIPLSAIKRNEEGNVCISNSDSEDLTFSYSMPLEDGYDPEKLSVFLLKRHQLPELNFFEIKLDDLTEKSGHLFPLQLYETENTDFLNQSPTPRIRRLQKVAIAAFCHIVRAYQLQGTEEQTNRNPISLTEHFGDEIAVLAISNDSTRIPPDFDLENYLPNLFKYGYIKSDINNTWTAPTESLDNETTLRLRKISTEIPNHIFFKKIFTDLLPNSWSPITSFFLCYQVIESCIEKIRLDNCNDFIAKLEATKHNAVKTRSTLTEYSGESSEKERIRKLFFFYLSKKPDTLLSAGKDLLVRLGEDASKLVDDHATLYSLRNYFFHAFPLVQSNCDEKNLRTISWECLLLTLEILFQFKTNQPASSLSGDNNPEEVTTKINQRDL